jgi:hypothetical protein
MAQHRGVEATREFAKQLGGDFINLEDGESIIAAFVGILQTDGEENEPAGDEVVWEEDGHGNSRSVEYDPAEHEKGQIKGRFSWNLYLKDTGEVKMLQRGLKFYNKFFAAKKKGQMTNWFEIERDGTGLDTTYYLKVKDKISERELEEIRSLDLHDLDRSMTGGGGEAGGSGKQRHRPPTSAPAKNSNGSGNGVVSDTVADELRQALKDLPNANEAMASFKAKFNVGKLKDLPSTEEAAARSWLAALAQSAPAEQQDSSVDPFE